MKKNTISLVVGILAMICMPKFVISQAMNKIDAVTQSSEALLFYETYFTNPSRQLLVKLETELSNKLNQQDELKNNIERGKLLKLSEKGEFEKEEDYKKREVKYNESIKEIETIAASLEYLVANTNFLENEIASLKTYITQLKPPTVYNEKFTSISRYNSEEESFILGFNSKSYWVQMPIGLAPEFKSNFLDIAILKYPDSLPKFIFNRHVFNLYNEDKKSNEILVSNGMIYRWVRIGTQIWMAENMSKYAGAGSWAYNNDESNISTYGRLYNFETAKKICPIGWHLPNNAEWTILTDYLGGRYVAGEKMKEVGTWHWNSPNTGATNSSGFTALPGGFRPSGNGLFRGLGNYGYWWSDAQRCKYLYYRDGKVQRRNDDGTDGFSVRCIKN